MQCLSNEGWAVVFDEKGRPIPNKDKCAGYEMARKLKSLIQNRAEQAKAGQCVFRIEEFKKASWTDIVEYYDKWIKNVVEKSRKPATIKNYKSYGRNWITPFFSERNLMLHEIEADTLQSFLNYVIDGLRKKPETSPKTALILKIHKENPELSGAAVQRKLLKDHDMKVAPSWVRRVINGKAGVNKPSKEKNVGKTAINILSALHTMMDYAHRAKRIATVPPFPKKEDYQLKPKDIDYLTPEELALVFAQIPAADLPIFQWLKLHFRRPGEACALHKSDYDQINEVFKVHRAISARKLVDSVKTNWKNQRSHLVDCDPDFIATANRLLRQNQDSPFMFVNPRARKDDGRYTLESLRNVWYAACDKAGIRRIWQYRGTKHMACMEFLENGGTDDELMMMTDHANRESVQAYREITLNRKRQARAAAKMRAEKRKEAPQAGHVPANVVFLFGDEERKQP